MLPRLVLDFKYYSLDVPNNWNYRPHHTQVFFFFFNSTRYPDSHEAISLGHFDLHFLIINSEQFFRYLLAT